MKRTIILIILTVSTNLIFSQTFENKLIQEYEELIVKKMESDKIVGVSAALIVNDSLIWEKGFGFADLENQIPMTKNTIVNIGSITKPVTALCAMQLQDKGLLDINQPVTKYLPQFHPKTRFGDINQIKVKDLIVHSAGIQSDIWKNSDLNSGKYTDVVGFINETQLLYPPGVLGFYSNSGYNILGHVLKEVSGVDYKNYVHENIFKALGMKNSGFWVDSLENKTKIYDNERNEVKEYPLRDIASGGIYCDVHDFALLAKGIINSYNDNIPAILKSKTMQEVFTVQNNDAGYVIGRNKRGLGWYLFTNETTNAANHTGSAGYAYAHIMVLPQDKAALVIFTNSSNGWNLCNQAGYKLLEHYNLEVQDVFLKPLISEKNESNVAFEVDENTLLNHVGYYSEALSYSQIFLENDTLRISQNDKIFNLIPVNENEFLPYDYQGKLIEDTRYYFKDIEPFHVLIQKNGNNEHVLGYKFYGVDTTKWNNKQGYYEHFGYQMIAGDTKFKGIELQISEDNILIVVLETMENNRFSVPLDVISENYATTAGLMSGYGMSVSFTENEKYHIIDFGGLTFRKEK